MALNWIHIEDYSFNCFMLMERFQIRLILTGIAPPQWKKGMNITLRSDSAEWKRNMGIALYYNPEVKWYFKHKCPECADIVDEVTADIHNGLDAGEVRRAEIYLIERAEDFVTYTTPEVMDTGCDFIYAWDKKHLLEMTDFKDKIVLDVGSGSGRLTFAAAEQARQVYSSEPVDMLREYLRDKISEKGIENIRVSDGVAHSLPYPDDTFDIVMSGHVVGDDYDAEIAELVRVVKSGGWILDCPGESSIKGNSAGEMISPGWEELHYTSSLGGDVYRYRKQIFK